MKDESKRFLERRANAERDVSFRRSSPKPREAPRTEAELEARARDLAGLTVRELAERMRLTLPPSSARGKGFAGTLAELALGADAGNRSEPDFIELRVELKTIPLDSRGRPLETTFVCTVPLPDIIELEFEDSPLYHKLRRVFFLPIEGEAELADRRFGVGFFYSPDEGELAVIRRDWELFGELIANQELEAIDGSLGEIVQIRPKGRDAQDRVLGPLQDDGLDYARPLGFYLRTRHTRAIVARALGL